MSWLIMGAGTVHVLPLSWQNQLSWAVNVCKQITVNSCSNAWLLTCSSLYIHKHAHSQTVKRSLDEFAWETYWKIILENFNCDFILSFHWNPIYHNCTLSMVNPVVAEHSAVRSSATCFTSLLISGALLQIRIQNWWIMASVRTGCSSAPKSVYVTFSPHCEWTFC